MSSVCVRTFAWMRAKKIHFFLSIVCLLLCLCCCNNCRRDRQGISWTLWPVASSRSQLCLWENCVLRVMLGKKILHNTACSKMPRAEKHCSTVEAREVTVIKNASCFIFPANRLSEVKFPLTYVTFLAETELRRCNVSEGIQWVSHDRSAVSL